jgi:hypothetical protein
MARDTPNRGNPAGCGRVRENIKRTIIQAARTNWNLELFALPPSRGRAKLVAGVFAANNSPMPKKISLRDARGKLISESFAVHERMITVTASDGWMKTAEIDEGMLSHETLAKCSCFGCTAGVVQARQCRAVTVANCGKRRSHLLMGQPWPTQLGASLDDTLCNGIPGWPRQSLPEVCQ